MAYTYTLKDKIFSFFGVNAKLRDTYKDLLNKGINERMNECLGEDYDDEVGPLVDNFHDNVLHPQKCLPEFIEFIEYMLGQPIIIYDTEAFRRKMIMLQNTITTIKGTQISHEVLFNMIGVSVVIINLVQLSGFDSEVEFDNETRRFDGSLTYCQHYTLELTGSAPQDAELNTLILRIALYLKPVNAEIYGITYNSNPVPLS